MCCMLLVANKPEHSQVDNLFKLLSPVRQILIENTLIHTLRDALRDTLRDTVRDTVRDSFKTKSTTEHKQQNHEPT